MPKPKITIQQQIHASGYLKQVLHSIPNEAALPPDLKEEYDAFCESHFNIAKDIEKNPKVRVISENDGGYKYGEFPAIEREGQRLFPNGLPNTFQQLNSGQRKFLVQYGAGTYAVSTKKIPQLYPDDLTFYNNKHKINKSVLAAKAAKDAEQDPVKYTLLKAKYFRRRERVRQQREYESLKNAVNAKRDAMLIYGDIHPFDVKTCFPDVDVEIKDQNYFPKREKAAFNKAKAYELSFREPVDCNKLAGGFFNTRPITANYPSTPVLENNPSDQNAYVLGTAALLLMSGYGLFRIGKSAYNYFTRENADIRQSAATDVQQPVEITGRKLNPDSKNNPHRRRKNS